MLRVNDNFQKLPGSYLFAEVARRVKVYQEAHPDREIIRLGIGDVTKPLVPAVVEAMHQAVEEMGHEETFHGYGPDFGYDFLINAIRQGDYASRGVEVAYDEVFISDGAKCDVGNIQELFSQDAVIAVTDPVYPVYVDSNAMAGRAGDYVGTAGTGWSTCPAMRRMALCRHCLTSRWTWCICATPIIPPAPCSPRHS